MTFANGFCLYYNKETISPYHKCDIVFPSIELPLFHCNSVLHTFEICKLLYFQNYDKLFYATSIKLPKDCIKVGYDIPNYNKSSWNNVKFDIMYQIEYQKYLQNEAERIELLEPKYDNIEFVYANPLDTYWGIGLGEYANSAMHKDKWKGLNRHNEILQKVRANLIKYYETM